jgi:flagella basal body P-ring formation protein FlgA
MRASKKIVGPASFLLMAVFLTAGGACAGQDTASDKEQKEDVARFKEFTDRVQEYVQLHKTVESNLPSLKFKEELPEVIVAHQQALARKLREARPHARPGDIFARGTREAFRHAVRSVFQGPQAAKARTTIKQGEALKEIHLRVNEVYPDAVPHTTVPPSLLLKLPQLPDEVAYRIVSHDLVLLDVKADMVVDLMPEILP